MRAAETNLRHLLDGNRQYRVPLFQRPYSWRTENWNTLWTDLMNLYSGEEEGYHFLGPIVTQSVPSSPDAVSPYIIIDGQQRLTTLALLIAALRDYLRNSGDKSKLPDELHDYLTNRYEEDEGHYKVLPTQVDRDSYQRLVGSKKATESSLICDAYSFFYEKLQDTESSKDSRLDASKLKNMLLSRLSLVSIFLDEQDDPYLIYESLNYKGCHLSQADLIRNYFFMRLPAKKHKEIYSEIWLPLEKRFKNEVNAGDQYLDELTNAFWYYLRKEGQAINSKLIYQSVKKRLEKKQAENIYIELKDLTKFSEYYLRIHFPNEEPEPKLRRWFERLGELEFTSSYPFLLNIYDDYEQKYIPLAEFEKILQYIESYLIRRWFAGIPSKGMNKTFVSLYQQLKKQHPYINANIVRMKLVGFERSQVWPSDEDFYKSIIEQPIYASNRDNKRIKFVLRSLQESLTKERVDFSNLTVEHVMPQTLAKDWVTTLGADASEINKKWGDTLGNLTVTAENSEMSNRSFEEKLKFLNKSNLSLNNYFRDVKQWNDEDIQCRARHLADLALEIWPR